MPPKAAAIGTYLQQQKRYWDKIARIENKQIKINRLLGDGKHKTQAAPAKFWAQVQHV